MWPTRPKNASASAETPGHVLAADEFPLPPTTPTLTAVDAPAETPSVSVSGALQSHPGPGRFSGLLSALRNAKAPESTDAGPTLTRAAVQAAWRTCEAPEVPEAALSAVESVVSERADWQDMPAQDFADAVVEKAMETAKASSPDGLETATAVAPAAAAAAAVFRLPKMSASVSAGAAGEEVRKVVHRAMNRVGFDPGDSRCGFAGDAAADVTLETLRPFENQDTTSPIRELPSKNIIGTFAKTIAVDVYQDMERSILDYHRVAPSNPVAREHENVTV